MTPERQAEIRQFLSELSDQFTERITKDDLNDLDHRLVNLQTIFVEGGDSTFLGMLEGINEEHGQADGDAAGRFYACCAAMTLATYLSRVDI